MELNGPCTYRVVMVAIVQSCQFWIFTVLITVHHRSPLFLSPFPQVPLPLLCRAAVWIRYRRCKPLRGSVGQYTLFTGHVKGSLLFSLGQQW